MGDQKKLCLCGAKNCSGYIGEKAHKLKKEKVLTPKNGDLKKKIKLKKKVEEKFVKIWEDVCFRYVLYINMNLIFSLILARQFKKNPSQKIMKRNESVSRNFCSIFLMENKFFREIIFSRVYSLDSIDFLTTVLLFCSIYFS